MDYIALACHAATCAPPPVGSGGSLPDRLYGKGLHALFPEGKSPLVSAPWARASRSKEFKDYDEQAVGDAIRAGKLTKVDPRVLRATQPHVTAPGVQHYMDKGDQSGVYADADKSSNKHPVVYVRTVNGKTEHVLLGGHHRATTALLEGRLLDAIVAEGGWGKPRRG